jgi:hypothetical protein
MCNVSCGHGSLATPIVGHVVRPPTIEVEVFGVVRGSLK